MEHSRDDTQGTPEAALGPAKGAGPDQAGFDALLRVPTGSLSRVNLMALQRAAGNQAVLGLLRAVAPPSGERRLTRLADTSAATATATRLEIVSDGAPARPGQIPRGAFLDEVERAVRDVVDHELAGTVFQSQGCPWIAHWMGYYRERTPAELHDALVQYAPAAGSAADLDGVLQAIRARVAAGIATWRATNAIPDLTPAPGAVPAAGAAAGASRALMRSTREPHDARSVQAELGPGRPLDPSVASRMSGLLGPDVSRARVHTDALGGRVAERHRATAVAVGDHVAFARGAYQPGTLLGDALIAHELAHVAQHVDTPGAPVAATAAAEREADAAGIAAFAQRGMPELLRGAAGSLRRSVRSGLALRRCDPHNWPTSPGVFGRAPQLVRPGFDRAGNVPGALPKVVDTAGVSSFDFDGDGDQSAELRADVKTAELWASGAAKRVTVGLTQLSSQTRLRGDFQLPDMSQGGGPPQVTVQETTDGDRPTVIALTLPTGTQELRVKPVQRFATTARYMLELTSRDGSTTSQPRVEQSIHYDFPVESAAINEVFATYDPNRDPDKQGPQDFVQVGGIWSLDMTVGAYGDRFRMTFRRVTEGVSTVEMGLAALAKPKGAGDDSDDQALAGHSIVLEVGGTLAPKILKKDATALVLDLDGDGTADVIVHDRLTLRAGAKDPGTKDRDHEITIAGPSATARRFSFPVRDGFILAGPATGAAVDFFAASDTHAVSSLLAQEQVGMFDEKKGQLLGELVSVERTLAALRKKAREENLISESLYKAWNQAEWDFAALAAYENAEPPADLVESVTKTAKTFFDELEHTTWRGEEDETGADDAIVAQKNPYTGTRKQIIRFGPSDIDAGGNFAAQISGRKWKDAGETYRKLVDGLDRWVAFVNREKYGQKTDADKPETQRALVGERLTGLRNALRELEPKSPTRVSAVLHTDEVFEHTGDIQEIPLSLYYWKEDDDWYVKDLTTPDDMPHWSISARAGETEPPSRLFYKLDDNDHFPKGMIHWMLPSGVAGVVRTTGPSTIKRWATYIGVGAAAIGLGLVTFGSGSVAVVGGYILAGSAVLGAATAGYDLYEKGTHGTLTAGTAVLDVAQIASAVTGLGALRFGRILAGVRTAAAEGAAVEATSAIQLAQRAYVPVRMAQVASDTVTLAVMSADLEKQVDRINRAQISDPERKRALALLFTQFAFTGGLTALSVKGLMPEMLGRGQDIAIVRYGDKEFAVPRGESVQGSEINQRAAKLGDAGDVAAQDQLLKSMGKIGGKAGSALTEIEMMRLRPDTTGNVTVDPAGKVSAGGKEAGNLADLVEKAQQANAAAAAHGVKWQYSLRISKAGADGASRVQVIAEPRASVAPGNDIASLQLFTNATTGRAQQIAGKTAQLKQLDVGSRIEILADGRLRINDQIDIGVELLSKLKQDELKALLKGTKELDATGWSLDTLKQRDRALFDEIEKSLLSTGAYRLRLAAHRTEGLRWAQTGLTLPPDLQTELGILMGEADEPSLTRFFDLANESSGFKEALDPQARSLFAKVALEGKPTSLADFVNRYQYARAEMIRQKAIAGKGVATEKPLLEKYEADKSLRDSIASAENAARTANAAKIGSVTIKPGSTSAETVNALREHPEQLKFGDDGTLTSHVRKHHNELPEAERAGQPGMKTTETDAYLDSARKTLLEQPPGGVKAMPTQDGLATVYTFERQRPGGKSGRTSKLLVLVRFDGQATILTFIP
jgi:hypothetical protein